MVDTAHRIVLPAPAPALGPAHTVARPPAPGQLVQPAFVPSVSAHTPPAAVGDALRVGPCGGRASVRAGGADRDCMAVAAASWRTAAARTPVHGKVRAPCSCS